MIGDKINLRELFTKSEFELPSWVRQDNIIYLIKNLRNGKGYVGQARWFPSRFIYEGLMSHFTAYVNCCMDGPKGYHIIYRALRKHKSRNFEVSILEELDNPDELDEKEKYWIKELHTCIYDPECWGYNMTWGGDDITHLRKALLILYPDTNGTPPQWFEAGQRKLKELYPETNGVPPQALIASRKRLVELYPDTNGMPPQCFEASRRRNLEMYPDTNGASPQFIEAGQKARKEAYPETNGVSPNSWKRSLEVRKEKYPETNGVPPECFEGSHRPEVEEKRQATNRARNGGVLAWNRDDVREIQHQTKVTLYGSVTGFMNTPESILNRTLSRFFSYYSNNVRKLNESELTSDSYFRVSTYNHLSKPFLYPQLKQDPRWTEEMENIFSGMYWDEELQRVELKSEFR